MTRSHTLKVGPKDASKGKHMMMARVHFPPADLLNDSCWRILFIWVLLVRQYTNNQSNGTATLGVREIINGLEDDSSQSCLILFRNGWNTYKLGFWTGINHFHWKKLLLACKILVFHQLRLSMEHHLRVSNIALGWGSLNLSVYISPAEIREGRGGFLTTILR